jgi:hypothetical protein
MSTDQGRASGTNLYHVFRYYIFPDENKANGNAGLIGGKIITVQGSIGRKPVIQQR